LIEIINIEQIRRIKYRLDINGLRAVAVISVVIYHIDKTVLKGGWLGVDIFFVISGYLITNIIISDLNTDKFSFKNFYLRRINRILPAVIVTLFFSFFLGYFLLLPGAFKEYLETSLSSLIFLANHYFLNLDFYTAESAKFVPLLHMWSLSIEEQFYILFPFVCFITYKYNKKVLIYLLTILFTISFFFNFLSNGSIIFYLFYFRIWELIAGSLAIFVNLNYSKSPMIQNASFIGIIFCLLNFSDANILEIYPKFLVIVFTFLFIANYSGEKLAIKLLVNKYIQNLGTWSFSIYLLHQPIFSFYKVFEAKSEILNLIGIGNLKKINNFVLFLILLITILLKKNIYKKKVV
jgi:peptidoglycan/LPS O-acetylase OafA/YrhL